MQITGLSTQRLKFRELHMDDYETLLPFFLNTEATQFYYSKINPRDYCRIWIQRQLNRYEEDGFGLFALIEKESGQFIGQCGLLRQKIDGQEELEIGYAIMPNYWLQGFAIESAIFFRDFAFQHNMATSLVSIIDINNVKSRKVAIKNCLEREKQTYQNEIKVDIYRISQITWKSLQKKN